MNYIRKALVSHQCLPYNRRVLNLVVLVNPCKGIVPVEIVGVLNNKRIFSVGVVRSLITVANVLRSLIVSERTRRVVQSVAVGVLYLANSPPLELHVLEIIERRVIPLVAHEPNNALSVRVVSPRKAVGVIVNRILQLPRRKVAIGKIRVTSMLNGSGVLVKR